YGAGLPTRSPSSSRVRLAFFRWKRRRRPRTIGSRVVVLLISVLGRKIARSYLREATDAGCERENTTVLMNQFHETAVERRVMTPDAVAFLVDLEREFG